MDITERLKEIIKQETDTDINIRTRKKKHSRNTFFILHNIKRIKTQ